MNFAAAKRAADADARNLKDGVESCPLKKTGLIILVYGGENDDALAGVSVTVGGNLVVTDRSGLARFIPIVAGDYTAHADADEGRSTLIAPDDEPVHINVGQCPIHALHMPIGVIPEITIRWDHDNSAVEGVEFEIVKSGAPKRTTVETGIAAWAARVRPYRYDVKAVFPDAAPYLLFENGTAALTLDLKANRQHTFKIKRMPVTFRVQKQVGALVEEVVDARVKIRDPSKELTTALVVDKAIAKLLVPVIKADQKKTCEVVSLTPDASDAVYEVVEVTST